MNEASPPPAKRQRLDNEAIADIDFTEDTDVENKFEINEKCEDYVNSQELQKLREFKVLDEVKSNEEDDSNDENSDNSSTGVPEEELEKMLDEDLPDDFKTAPKPKDKAYVTRTKIVLEEKGVNQFENLPLDWMMVRHYSGMPIYMHRSSRVCTLSKPYFIGKGNTRRHDIPISAIPCLAYRRALEEEEKQNKIDRKIEEQIRNQTGAGNDDPPCVAIENKNVINEENTPNNDNPLQESQIETNNQEDDAAESNENNDNKEINQRSADESNECLNSDPISVATELKCPYASRDPGGEDQIATGEAHSSATDVEVTVKIETDVSNDADVELSNQSIKQEGDLPNEAADNENAEDEIPVGRRPVVLPGGAMMPPPRVESANSSWKTRDLTPEQVNEYCKNLFQFKSVSIMHFKRWADRRKYTKARKTLQYPALPPGTTLITIPKHHGTDAGGKSAKRDWVMNMNGRSYLSVFHEYVCRALQKQPVYEYKQLENASAPYQAAVYIGGMQYGVGRGSSKRQAKYAAARASIHILIPEMREHLEPPADEQQGDTDFSFFDYVGIEDPRIAEFCASTCEPSPHAILRTCLLRNFGAGDRHIHTEMKKLEYQKTELTMKVGKHTATVVCKNKKTAKQRASQAILQALHPHVRSWGSLLRLYGSRSVKSCKEKKLEEQQITLLQDKARQNEPNHAVLTKLRHEMTKLRERDAAVVPIGTLLLHDDPPTHSASHLNNVDL